MTASASLLGAQAVPASRPTLLAALEHQVLAARHRAALARSRDTADGGARLRHPVRVARWMADWRRTAAGPLRQVLAAAVLLNGDTVQVTAAAAGAIGATLDPTSDAWARADAHYADAMGAAIRLADHRGLTPERASANAAFRARWLAALDSALARGDLNADARRQVLVRAARVRGRRESLAAAAPYVAQLARDFPRDHDAQMTVAAYGATGPVRIGARAPDFRVRSLDGGSVITRDSLAGRVVLIDAWATWCGPCLAEMPVIERAWRRHRARGFEVLSVSMDTHAGLVARFRATRHPMPWRHGFATILDDLPVIFGIKQVPRAVLLGRDGTVLAMDEELRGDALEEAVRAALARPR